MELMKTSTENLITTNQIQWPTSDVGKILKKCLEIPKYVDDPDYAGCQGWNDPRWTTLDHSGFLTLLNLFLEHADVEIPQTLE